MNQYDVVIIGAGPGGYVSAIKASQLGLIAAVIEKEFMGGVCLNIGCVPSKSLLKNAEVAHTLRERGREFGFSFDNLELDYSVAVKRSRRVSKRLTRGVEFLMKKNNVDVFQGFGKIISKEKVIVSSEDGAETELQAENIIIATGASPFIIPGVEVDGEKVLTYREAILQETLPESVVIIGGGPIGLEFATIWNSYGVPVTIVEMMDHLASYEDMDIITELEKSFKKDGVKLMTSSKVTGVQRGGDIVRVSVENGGETKVIETDQVLLAASFVPNSKNIGLEELGVELDRRGFVQINSQMQTNIDGVYAIGDVTGKLMLAHVGMAMGIVAAEKIAGQDPAELNYVNMPKATYSHPQLASFGLTEQEAVKEGHEVEIGRFNFQANGKALGLGDYAGFVKVVKDAKSGKILGTHMIGPEVTELLPEFTLAQMNGLTTAEIAKNIHAHPTLSEVLQEAAEAAEGHGIHS